MKYIKTTVSTLIRLIYMQGEFDYKIIYNASIINTTKLMIVSMLYGFLLQSWWLYPCYMDFWKKNLKVLPYLLNSSIW